jgi:hypothetical protein
MAGRMTEAGILRASQRLGCEVAAIRAVIEVECGGSGFLADGRPRVLFEAHVFSRETGGKFDRSHPTLSSPTWNRDLYQGGAAEYGRLYAALQLDGDAALRACSWGAFQIMGFNWRACSEASLPGFVLAMHHNEDAHLALFACFIQSQGLAPALRSRDWTAFASKYNGPAYAKNHYHTRLEQAYRKHAQEGRNAK